MSTQETPLVPDENRPDSPACKEVEPHVYADKTTLKLKQIPGIYYI